MLILKWYAISVIPALLWAISMTLEDLLCKYGYRKPDSKFGYHWQPLKKWDQSISMLALGVLLIPVVNILFLVIMLVGALINVVGPKH